MYARRAGTLYALGLCAIAAVSCAPEPQPEAEVAGDTTVVEGDFATTPQMRRALSTDLAAAQLALDSLEASVYLLIGDTLAIDLRAVRDRWLEYRRHQCEALASIFTGGTYAPVIELECLVVLTRRRREFLVEHFDFVRGVEPTPAVGGGASQP